MLKCFSSKKYRTTNSKEGMTSSKNESKSVSFGIRRNSRDYLWPSTKIISLLDYQFLLLHAEREISTVTSNCASGSYH